MRSSAVLSVRVSEAEREILERVARNSRSKVSDFVRRKALEAAEIELMQRNEIMIDPAQWEAFEAWLEQPAKRTDRLEALAKQTPGWVQ